MDTERSAGPPACEFRRGELILEVDELVGSRIEVISRMVPRLMNLLKATCCKPDQEYAVETALREALANAILHGNRQNPRKRVRVCCGCETGGGILILIRDEGEGFDPAAIPSPVVGENIEAEHGRGLFLIRLFMDEVRFERGGRDIRMRKRPKTP